MSRRKLIEDRRKLQKDKLMSELEIGQIRRGVVKNIAEFGAFVDLGGRKVHPRTVGDSTPARIRSTGPDSPPD